jgi:NAD(P)H-hydrate epimerase
MNNPQASASPSTGAGMAKTEASQVPGALLPQPAADTHKHARGSVLVVAGGIEGVGAPRLAARMALRIGAGLVTIASPREAMPAHGARGPDALMLRQIETGDDLVALAARQPSGLAVVIGPALGFDPRAASLLAAALNLPCALVLDADALTLLARDDGWRDELSRRNGPTVLTPHEGEFSRLDPAARLNASSSEDKPACRLDAATRMAQSSGAVVVLKGPGTVIAAPSGESVVNPTGSSALATAGSGDVLAGAIAGLIAQGMPAFEAARAAAWLHGRAGEALGHGMIADDLLEMIGRLRWQASGQSPAR